MNFTNFKNRIMILVFIIVLVSPWVLGAVFGIAMPKTFKKLSVVETEKRNMKTIQWDNLLNTGESVSEFVDDRIPFRYTLISWYKYINDAVEDKYQQAASFVGQKIYSAKDDKENEDAARNKPIVPGEVVNPVEEAAQEQLPDDYFPLQTYEDVIIARDGWLFLYGENEIECYQGTNLLNDEQLQNFAGKLNQLQDICECVPRYLANTCLRWKS